MMHWCRVSAAPQRASISTALIRQMRRGAQLTKKTPFKSRVRDVRDFHYWGAACIIKEPRRISLSRVQLLDVVYTRCIYVSLDWRESNNHRTRISITPSNAVNEYAHRFNIYSDILWSDVYFCFIECRVESTSCRVRGELVSSVAVNCIMCFSVCLYFIWYMWRPYRGVVVGGRRALLDSERDEGLHIDYARHTATHRAARWGNFNKANQTKQLQVWSEKNTNSIINVGYCFEFEFDCTSIPNIEMVELQKWNVQYCLLSNV